MDRAQVQPKKISVADDEVEFTEEAAVGFAARLGKIVEEHERR